MHKFIGYGSLINSLSLKKTIDDKKFTPIIVKGYKRIFNLYVKDGAKTNVLNVVKEKDKFFNGVLFEVNDKELKKIKKREEGYNFRKVNAYDFKTGKKIGKGIISIFYLKKSDKINKNPNKKYFKICRNGAYKISKEFGKMWDETTYNSDSKKIINWMNNQNLIK